MLSQRVPPSNGVRLSCGAPKKESSFNILRASRLARLPAQATIVYNKFVWLNWMLDFRPTVNALPEKVAQFVETFRRQFNIAKP